MTALALGMAAVGLFGLIAYSVTTRAGEFGIQMAGGARGNDILLHVLHESLLVAAIGEGVGGAAPRAPCSAR